MLRFTRYPFLVQKVIPTGLSSLANAFFPLPCAFLVAGRMWSVSWFESELRQIFGLGHCSRRAYDISNRLKRTRRTEIVYVAKFYTSMPSKLVPRRGRRIYTSRPHPSKDIKSKDPPEAGQIHVRTKVGGMALAALTKVGGKDVA